MGADGTVLTAEQIDRFRELGYVFPVEVLSDDEAAAARARLEAHEAAIGHAIGPDQRAKSHYLFTWVDELIRDERLLDAVEDLIGPDILCWSTIWWIKEPHSPSYVGWHQDLQYWGLDTDDLVTVWLALAPAPEASGCMSVIPGSHRERLEHLETYHEHNMLTRGQELTIDVDARSPVAMPLAAGQASIHHGRSAHGSGPNTTDDRRIGLSIQYMPTSTRQTLTDWDTAALVRGVDEYHHFEHGEPPASDLHPDAVAFHARAAQALRELIYVGAEREVDSTL